MLSSQKHCSHSPKAAKSLIPSLLLGSSQSKESSAFPFQDGRPRVFHIDSLSEQQKGIAMVTASPEVLGKTVGPMDPNSKADLCIRQPQPKRSQYEKEKKLLFPPHKFRKGTDGKPKIASQL